MVAAGPTNHNVLFWLYFIFPYTEETSPAFGAFCDWFGSPFVSNWLSEKRSPDFYPFVSASNEPFPEIGDAASWRRGSHSPETGSILALG
jgi:hypothetical protein